MTADQPDLTYGEATAEQVNAARAEARRKLADARRRHDDTYWERLRARFGVTANPA